MNQKEIFEDIMSTVGELISKSSAKGLDRIDSSSADVTYNDDGSAYIELYDGTNFHAWRKSNREDEPPEHTVYRLTLTVHKG